MSAIFSKPPLSIEAHIELLQKRGMLISDIATATHYLANVGYYRLAGYWCVFQKDVVTHEFLPNVTFEQVVDHYNFDRALRLLIFDAIERIEVSFRAYLSNTISLVHGAFWFENKAIFDDYFEKNLEAIDDELFRSRKEEFIKHHQNKYGNDRPPCWKTLEILSLGNLSKIYSSLKDSGLKNKIAHSLQLPNYVFLESWMQSLATLRNACAHHARLWNKLFEFPAKKMTIAKQNWIKNIPSTHSDLQRLYYQLCSVKYLVDVVSPGNTFSDKLKSIINKHPVNIRSLGFPNNWQQEMLWE